MDVLNYDLFYRVLVERNEAAATNDGSDDGDGKWYDNYFPDSSDFSNNTSITTSVTIYVSPDSFSFVSWVLLWFGFVMTISLATYQVYTEHQWMTAQIQRILNNNSDVEGGGGQQHQGNGRSSNSNNNGAIYRQQQQHRPPGSSSSSSQYHHHGPSRGSGYITRHGHRRTNSGGNHSTSGSSGGAGAGGDGEIISSADMSRNLVRGILLIRFRCFEFENERCLLC